MKMFYDNYDTYESSDNESEENYISNEYDFYATFIEYLLDFLILHYNYERENEKYNFLIKKLNNYFTNLKIEFINNYDIQNYHNFYNDIINDINIINIKKIYDKLYEKEQLKYILYDIVNNINIDNFEYDNLNLNDVNYFLELLNNNNIIVNECVGICDKLQVFILLKNLLNKKNNIECVVNNICDSIVIINKISKFLLNLSYNDCITPIKKKLFYIHKKNNFSNNKKTLLHFIYENYNEIF